MRGTLAILVATIYPFVLQAVDSSPKALHISSFDSEGIAINVVAADPTTGALGEFRPVFHRAGTMLIGSLEANAVGDRLVCVSPNEDDPAGRFVFLVDSNGGDKAVRTLTVPEKPERAIFWGADKVLVHTSRGELHLIDHPTGKILKSVVVRHLVEPKAHLIESIALAPGQPTVVCVMKEDAPGPRDRVGGRLIGLSLPALEVQFDLRIDADVVASLDSTGTYTAEALKALSFGTASRLQGAAPNGIAFSPATNSVAVSLDNWGAVIVADLDAFLEGRWTNAALLSPQSVPGTWYPNPPVAVVMGGVDDFVVSSAGASGGVSIVDARQRKIVQTLALEAPATLAWPVILPDRKLAVFAHAGLTRFRGTERVEEKHQEMNELVILDFSEGANAVRLRRRKFSDMLYHVARLLPGSERFLMVGFLRLEPRGMKLGVYDLDKETLADERMVEDVLRGHAFAVSTPTQ